jgi:hypothetical protein
MKTYNIIFNSKFLYIFFIFLSLNIFFFSTVNSEGKAFEINNIDISRPFEINFDKNDVLDEGFNTAFSQLISAITKSSDQKKLNSIKLNEIKSMIETFTIKEEKFVNEMYYVNLGVSFNKKKVFSYLESKNIFPSIPKRKKFLFIPIIIDENEKDLLIFYNNKIFLDWNKNTESNSLIHYILPEEDLEDLDLIKNKFETIEQYDFKDITSKYDLDNSIIALIFKNEKKIRILSRITVKEDMILKNQSYNNVDLYKEDQVKGLINNLKNIYEDYWKSLNLINTSIKLSINVKIDNKDNQKILNFEKKLKEIDLVYNFFISKIDKNFTYFRVIFNGTPSVFLKTMRSDNFIFDTKNKFWILQ